MSTINIWAGWQKGLFHSNMKSSSWLLCYGVSIVQFFIQSFVLRHLVIALVRNTKKPQLIYTRYASMT